MPLTWAEGLENRLRTADLAIKRPDAPSTGGLWTSLAIQVAPAERRPVMAPNLVVRELHDRQTPYLVLKNPAAHTYMRVTPEEYQLLQKLNGETSVQDLIVDHYMETGEFSRAKVFHLVQKLHQNHMLTEQPLSSWGQVRDALERKTWAYRLSAPAKFILTRRLNIHHLDRLIGKIYRGGGWIFFSRPFQILFLLVSLLGIAAFVFIVREGALSFFGENLIRSLVGFYVAAVFTILIHELGHALTVKHYGRVVHKGGLLLFFGMPAAFVDTTDIWLEPRRARLAVTWNGPYTGLILGGLASLLIYSFPRSPGNLLLYQLAGYAYATVFMNINPLLKLDGYYLLMDALDISSLRERSIYFVTRRLLPGIFHKDKFGREERIFSIYGLLTILWTGYALYFAFFFWRTRISRSLQGVFSTTPTFFGVVRTLALALLLASFGALLLFSVLKLGKVLKNRVVRSGLLAKHGTYAFWLAALAFLLGYGVPRQVPQYIPLLSVLFFFTSLGIAFRFWTIIRPYRGAPRYVANLSFWGVGLLAGLTHLAGLWAIPWLIWQTVVWGVVGILLFAGGVLLLPPRRKYGMKKQPFAWRNFIYGLLGAGLGGSLVVQFAALCLESPLLWGVILLGTVGGWVVATLWGGARAPAVLLFFLGGLGLLLTLFLPSPFQYGFTGGLLFLCGGLHFISVRLPPLSVHDTAGLSDTHEAIGVSVAVLVHRVIAQVFFEAGWRGAGQLGYAFSKVMAENGLALTIYRNQFEDKELLQRTAAELTEGYRVAFEVLSNILRHMLGHEAGRLTFGYGLDLLPWQNREIVAELVLSRMEWGADLKDDTKKSKDALLATLNRVPLFVSFSLPEREEVAGLLESKRYYAGQIILRQGEPGNTFYILSQGEVSVWVKDTLGDEREVEHIGAGQFFGEAALVSNQPRNATVLAETPVALYALKQEAFFNLLHKHPTMRNKLDARVKHSWLLRGMPLFDELKSGEVDMLARQLKVVKYLEGIVVCKQGEEGDNFFIVEEGRVRITHEVNGREIALSHRGPGEYFGEIALLLACPRTATVTTEAPTTLLALTGADFQEIASSYSKFRKAVAQTGSRRLAFVEKAGQSRRPNHP